MRAIVSLMVFAAAGLVGCTPAGFETFSTEEPVAPNILTSDSLGQRQELARRYVAAGELAAAAAQWQILAILDPDEPSFRAELKATREVLARSAAAWYQNAQAALKAGDAEGAAQSLLQVLALEPDHAQAGSILRRIEREKIARVQANKANRARREEESGQRQEATAALAADYRRSFDLEQTLELFEAGDSDGGLRELLRYVKANPADKAGRRRISKVVFEQAQRLDAPATRERANGLYEQAIALRGEPPQVWDARLSATRKALANDYYEKGLRSSRNDLAQAMKYWENCLNYNPQHVGCGLRLKDAQSFQAQLKRIERDQAGR